MTAKLLSIDSPPNWSMLLRNQLISDARSICRTTPGKLYSLLDQIPPFCNLVGTLRQEISFHKHTFDKIQAFHGCSIIDESTYTEHGLQISNHETLKQLAYKIFPNRDDVDNAISQLSKGYIDHNSGKIYFCPSRKHLETVGIDHTYGSEFLRAIANRINHGKEIYNKTRGKSAIIEVRLPREWLNDRLMRGFLCQSFLQWLFASEDKPHSQTIVSGGFWIDRDVEPENIASIDFIQSRTYERN